MFKDDFRNYNQQHHYKHFHWQDGDFRYILSGKSDKPVMIFLNGLDMQEMWLHYMALLTPVGARAVYMTGGHLSFVCEPESYIKAIRGFLETIAC